MEYNVLLNVSKTNTIVTANNSIDNREEFKGKITEQVQPLIYLGSVIIETE